jgi:hypothetical protein
MIKSIKTISRLDFKSLSIRLLKSFTLALLFAVPLASAQYTVTTPNANLRHYSFEIEPGQKIESTIIINNLGNSALKATLYGADSTHSNLGTFALTAAGSEQKHIGKWVKFKEPTIVIPPKKELEIPFEIILPEKVTPGDYAGGIAVEGLPIQQKVETYIQMEDGSTVKNTENNAGSQVNVTSRFITKLYVSVPGEKTYDYALTSFTYDAGHQSKKPVFALSFKNDGNTIIQAEPKINIAGLPGITPDSLAMSSISLQPGMTLKNIETRWENRPSFGLYKTSAVVDFYELDIINNEKIFLETKTLNTPLINLTPWYYAVIIAAIVLFLIAAPLFLFIRKRIYIAGCYKYKTQDGENIIDIAKKHKADWKRIAKINKIKPPYNLKKGQTLLVPKK